MTPAAAHQAAAKPLSDFHSHESFLVFSDAIMTLFDIFSDNFKHGKATVGTVSLLLRLQVYHSATGSLTCS